jgi:hypothetical protein
MTERICVARLSPEDIDSIQALYSSTRRVHKSHPPSHPVRLASNELSTLLARFHRRSVPIDVMAAEMKLSHQAVRARIRNVELGSREFDSSNADVIDEPDDSVVFVVDSGVHRRLHVYDKPTSLSYLIPVIPVLRTADDVRSWLESESDIVPGDLSTATALRTPPAVYVARDVVDTVLVELSSESETP